VPLAECGPISPLGPFIGISSEPLGILDLVFLAIAESPPLAKRGGL